MARKAIVDKEAILTMLRDGETTQQIAERYNVSRQAIDLHRKDFIKKGLLPDKRAPRTRKTDSEYRYEIKPAATPPPPPSPAPAPVPGNAGVSLDEHIDLIIEAFNALKQLPAIQKELDDYRREHERTLHEIERLQEQLRKRLDQENRWLLTQTDDSSTS